VSFKVLVIPEDPTYNGYILKPLCERILEEGGRPRALITILTNPKVSGYADAKTKLLSEIPELWSHMDLMSFICDADGKDRCAEFSELERRLLELRIAQRNSFVALPCRSWKHGSLRGILKK
jgi:hypothetical protein